MLADQMLLEVNSVKNPLFTSLKLLKTHIDNKTTLGNSYRTEIVQNMFSGYTESN